MSVLPPPPAPPGPSPQFVRLPPPRPLPQPPPAPKRRVGWIVGLAIAVGAVFLLVVVGIGALVLGGLDQALTHDLVDTDFAVTAEPFEVGSDEAYRFDLDGGTYRITSTNGFDPEAPQPALTVADFPRIAYVVDGNASIAEPGPDGTMVGVGCNEYVPGKSSAYSAYLFVTDETGYALLHITSGRTGDVIASVDAGAPLAPGDQLGLRCSWPGPLNGADGVRLTASVNGRTVLTGEHEPVAGADGFDYLVLAFVATAPGQDVRFTGATAHVPE